MQKTTAGTVGAQAVADARMVLCTSFPVAGATARYLRETDCLDVTFVITGEDGAAEEDLACAHYVARRATAESPLDAAEFTKRAADSRAAEDLRTGVRLGVHPDDVALCLEVDRFSFAMRADQEDGLLVLRQAFITAGGA